MVVQDLIKAVGYCQRLAHASHPRLAQNVSAGRKERGQNIPSHQLINKLSVMTTKKKILQDFETILNFESRKEK
jgi:hypothetical protein